MALIEAGSSGSSSAIQKRSVRIAGHPTSISLEDAFWEALREIAAVRKLRLSELVEEIDSRRGSQNLSSAIRVYVLGSYRGGQRDN
ncbi:MAG: ribbon-helix-helix domain-containing protein [Minwuia sp.]|uniref:ribbon-helix-helix domain-containing protein n=1 Tax=Minwuia sp. TaxID=2493630 RepID=UPI003A88F365